MIDTLTWSKPRTSGQIPPPCRAHSCTTVELESGKLKSKNFALYVFGGGDGPHYFNDLYVLNTGKREMVNGSICIEYIT
jgi:hypothetical protein